MEVIRFNGYFQTEQTVLQQMESSGSAFHSIVHFYHTWKRRVSNWAGDLRAGL
jgi:hypothetical protein